MNGFFCWRCFGLGFLWSGIVGLGVALEGGGVGLSVWFKEVFLFGLGWGFKFVF